MASAPPRRPTTDVSAVILDSLDGMVAQLFARLDGIDDDEYLWEPVADMWTVRRLADEGLVQVDMSSDRGIDPAPVTTIAWRLWHLSLDCFDDYTRRFRGDEADAVRSWFLEAAPAISSLHRSWNGFRATLIAQDDWWAELGDRWGPFSRHCVADIAMHASNELVHHAAEIGLLRDLYLHRSTD